MKSSREKEKTYFKPIYSAAGTKINYIEFPLSYQNRNLSQNKAFVLQSQNSSKSKANF